MREFLRSNHFVSQDLDIRSDAPAAKAWQVSRHTPTLVWSLTWSMMLLSSEKRPPTVLPWPLMFSNTDHIEGRQRRDGHQFQDTTLDTRVHFIPAAQCGVLLLKRGKTDLIQAFSAYVSCKWYFKCVTPVNQTCNVI